ncbi:PAS domain-containing sensor histidine kinase [Paenibacillus koleovorans]|uniref:PAS domain-containing sensor histidine kinase n=1 Tax=Paenibacillus koleovorans TaxID=121608 RepID=UPI000FD9B248|nr:PAS domain-containing sensor histidine kinase [Paenibacillus koleovorans]
MKLVSTEEERTLLQSFVAISVVASGWMDLEGNWLAVNTALCMLSGFTEAEWLVTGPVGPVLLMLEHRIVSPLECIAESKPGQVAKLIHRHGSTEVGLYWNPIETPSGHSTGYLVQFKEIIPAPQEHGDFKQRSPKEFMLERALHVSKQHYKSLFEHHPDAVFSLDLHGRFITMNGSFERIAGFSADEMFQTLFMNRIGSDDRPTALDFFRQAVSGAAQEFMGRILHKNGSMLDARIYFLPIQVERETLGVYGIAKDITEEKRLLENLRSSREQHRLIEENTFDLFFRLDLEGQILYISPSCERMLGYKQEEMLGLDSKGFVHPDDLSYMIETFDSQQARGSESTLHSFRFIHKNGSYVWMESMNTLIRDIHSGEVTSMLSVARDITVRKEAEELMLRSEKLLMAGQLAAGIAHEIRNPLTSIKGFLQLLSSQLRDKQDYIGIMRSELNRIEAITSELLLLAKPHAKSFRELDVRELLRQVASIMEPQAILNNVVIELICGNEPLPIQCDENQLKQVFINFVKNAIEAMPAGGQIQVRIERKQQLAVVSVQDQGCGIPEERLASIWQPFFTTKEKGTGLGLMVSYSIIENHHGTIQVASRQGIGSTFVIQLPILHGHAAQE